jgi:hypothetical protein
MDFKNIYLRIKLNITLFNVVLQFKGTKTAKKYIFFLEKIVQRI